MARVVADDEQNAAPFNELAFVADFLNAGTDFHDTLSRRGAIQSIAVYEESARFHKGLEHDFRHSQTTYNHRTFYLNFHFGDLKAESIELGRPRQPRVDQPPDRYAPGAGTSGPAVSKYGPSFVTAIVCSKWALGFPSYVT